MHKEVEALRESMEQLESMKKQLGEEFTMISSQLNAEDQKLRNVLAQIYVGKYVKTCFGDANEVLYGLVHGVVDVNHVSVNMIGFTVNNKLDKSCTRFSLDDIKIVPDEEARDYIFKLVERRLKSNSFVENL